MRSAIQRWPTLRATLSAVVFTSIAVPIAGAPPAQELIVKMASPAPDGSRWHLALKEMAARWKSASAGRVVVRLFPGGVAGDDQDVVRKLRAGTLQAGVVMTIGLGQIDPSAYVLCLPMAYESHEEAYFVLEQMRPRLEASILAKGFVVLNWVDGGFIHFFSKKPITVPDDLRTLKLFSWAGDDDALAVWKAAGFNPVPLPVTELAAALDRGAVDAFGMPPQLAVVSQHYTKAGNMSLLPWQLWIGATLATKTVWDQVPAETRPALLQAAQEAGEALRRDVRESADRAVVEMKKRGLNAVSVDARARETWRKTTEAMFPKIRGEIVPADAFDEALKWRDEYRQRPGVKKRSVP